PAIGGGQGLDLGNAGAIAGARGFQGAHLFVSGEIGGGDKPLLNSIPILERRWLSESTSPPPPPAGVSAAPLVFAPRGRPMPGGCARTTVAPGQSHPCFSSSHRNGRRRTWRRWCGKAEPASSPATAPLRKRLLRGLAGPRHPALWRPGPDPIP